MLDALVIAPHPDDAELGMGGTIGLMLAQGLAVGILDLTDGEPTPLGSPEIRARETAAATAALGVAWRENLGLPNRRLRATLSARARLAGVIRHTRPRWLFAPHWIDAHPDHVAATKLTEAARFWSKGVTLRGLATPISTSCFILKLHCPPPNIYARIADRISPRRSRLA